MNVTYLLGAGASANALPTYENFKSRYDKFLMLFHETNINALESFERSFANNIYSVGQIFSEEFIFHNTPDTIAKKYFHTGDEKLKLLKQILVLFFLYEQTFKNKGESYFDKRYDAFVATILKPIEKKIELDNQFNIITWNYDLQFEIAFSRYYSKTLNEVQQKVQSFPNLFGFTNEFKIENFSINHLNGIAYAKPTKHGDSIGKTISEVSSLQRYLIDVWNNLTDAQLISFAWENIYMEDFLEDNNLVLNNAFSVAKRTEILVVIGYSFPLFNRLIDVNLFRKIEKLKKIYIQSTQAIQIQNIITSEIMNKSVVCTDVGYTNQFHIPFESSINKIKGISIS